MYADEEEAPSERKFFLRVAASSGLARSEASKIVEIVKTRDLDSIELASAILRRDLDRLGRRRIMELWIGMMIADGYVTIAEQHVIRFIADLLDIDIATFKGIYRSVTGQEMPLMGDPSSANWWRRKSPSGSERCAQEEKSGHSHQSGRQEAPPSRSESQDAQALRVLGLDENATLRDIKKAFRRLAHIHHPDRFTQLGPEAQAAAKENFQRINSAYQHLT